MGKRFGEADTALSYPRNFSAFMAPMIYYCFHKSPPRVPIQSQLNPVRILPPYFPEIHFNIIVPSTPKLSFIHEGTNNNNNNNNNAHDYHASQQ
jgi:hypothetical protein